MPELREGKRALREKIQTEKRERAKWKTLDE
jgi:hypothetical protein